MTINTIASSLDLWEGLKRPFLKKTQFSMNIYTLKMTSYIKLGGKFFWCCVNSRLRIFKQFCKMSIVVPWSCKKYSLPKTQVLLFNIKSIYFKIKGILNLGWISLYFNKNYLTASSPKVCGLFLYRSTTSKVAITAFSSVFSKSIRSLM